MLNNSSDNGELHGAQSYGLTGQSRGNFRDAVWLAAMLDGEGCISARFIWNKKYPDMPRVGLRISIGNTCNDLQDEVEAVVERITGTHRKSYNQAVDSKRKPIRNLHITSSEDIFKVLTAVLPHLIAKKTQAELVLSWIEQRQEASRKTGLKNAPYQTDFEVNVVNMLQWLNTRGPNIPERAVETKRRAPRWKGNHAEQL